MLTSRWCCQTKQVCGSLSHHAVYFVCIINFVITAPFPASVGEAATKRQQRGRYTSPTFRCAWEEGGVDEGRSCLTIGHLALEMHQVL